MLAKKTAGSTRRKLGGAGGGGSSYSSMRGVTVPREGRRGGGGSSSQNKEKKRWRPLVESFLFPNCKMKVSLLQCLSLLLVNLLIFKLSRPNFSGVGGSFPAQFIFCG